MWDGKKAVACMAEGRKDDTACNLKYVVTIKLCFPLNDDFNIVFMTY